MTRMGLLRRNSTRTSVLLLSGSLLLPACTDRGEAPVEPVRGGTVVVAGPTDLDFANPLLAASKYTQELIRYALFMPLIRYDSTLAYAPALAESWELIGDTAVEFRLRRDVHWHDGPPTTAHDVAFTFDRALDPVTTYPNSDYLAAWTGVEVVDSYTVRVKFRPHAAALAPFPFMAIAPRHLLDSIPAERLRQAAFNKAPVGNGPFRFVSYAANDRWTFAANDSFPESLGGRPYIDRLIYRIMPEQAPQVAELTAGTLDLGLNPPSGQWAELDSLPHVRAIARPSREFAFIGWNTRRPPLDDPRVRRALAMAVDRREILALRYGHGELAVGPVPPYHPAYPDDIPPLPFAPDSAVALLAEAGITDRDGDGVLDTADGEPFTIELMVPANNAFNRDMAEVIRSHLADVGVTVDVRYTEFGTMIGVITVPSRAFDAFLLSWEGDFRLNIRNIFHSAEREGPYGFAGYSNPVVDSLIDALAVTSDPERARPMFADLQRIMREEQPWMFLHYYPDLFAANERVQDLRMDIRGAFVTVADWWISGSAGPEQSDSTAPSPSRDSAPGQ